MRRRGFVRFLAGVAVAVSLAWPVVLGAQQAGTPKRIVWVSGGYVDSVYDARVACFKEGLVPLGWIEGQTVAFEHKRAGTAGVEALLELAEAAARLKPDLILTLSTPQTQVVKRAIRDIPVVFMSVSDPVASGIVKSLARPEGNVTGVSNFLPATTAKLLEFVKQMVPAAKRVAFLYDSANPGKRIELEILNKAAPGLGMTIEPHELRSVADIDGVFAALAKSPPSALLVPVDRVTTAGMERIVALAAKLRRPAVYQTREFVEAGGLLSYGLDLCQHIRRAATYADKILKGAKPGDLPVELPSTFDLVINLKAAKALGLKVPQSLLVRADRVIE